MLVLAIAPYREARADLGDCFTALAPVGQAAKAAKVGSTAAACMSAASGDPMMAMVIAAMTAAAVGGMFSTIDECNALVETNLGQVVAAALLKLPLPLTDEQKTLLTQFASGHMPPGVSFTELIAAIPGLNALPAYLKCGCNVAGAPGEFEKIANEYKESVQGCGDFFGDAKDAFFEWVGSGMESLFGGHDFVPGVQQEFSCYKYVMPPNIWTSVKLIAPGEEGGNMCDNTYCPSGYVILEKTAPSGSKQHICLANCPTPTKKFTPGGSCYGTDEWTKSGGRCRPAHSEQCCAPGEKVETWGVCEPRCALSEYYDTKKAVCSKCPPGLTNALTSCKPCPGGHVIWSFDQPGAPKPPGNVVIRIPPAEPAGPQPPSSRAVPPESAQSSGPVTQRGQETVTATPGGPTIATEPGKCVPCPRNWIPVYYADPAKNSLGYCRECPPRTYANVNKCLPLNCPGGYDPNDPHACRQRGTYPVAPVPPPLPHDSSIRRPGAGPATTSVPPPGDRRFAPPGTTIQRAPPTVPQQKTQQKPPPAVIQQAPTMRLAPPPCSPGLRFVNGQCVR